MEKYGKFRQTLLVLQFVIEFANIWAQYSPSTYASTHVGFFDLCPNVQMAALSGCLSVTPLLLHGRTSAALADGVRQVKVAQRPSEAVYKPKPRVSPSITRILATANVTHRAI